MPGMGNPNRYQPDEDAGLTSPGLRRACAPLNMPPAPGLDPAGITVFFQEPRFPGQGTVSEETFLLAGLMLKY